MKAKPMEFWVEKNLWIPLSDGARLAARAWLPNICRNRPVPAILEYLPYRKNDIKALRDWGIHSYFAQRGYACVRVDLRGSGDSDGILRDEYLQQELEDGLEVLNWIAAQKWCNGRIGMIGLSWGGFNALQIAALNPKPLKAIMTVSSSDDRFSDDVHYMGGCLLSDNLSWAGNMFAFNSLPPDPEVVGSRWKAMWLERLHASQPWALEWMRHQTRDAYWRHGSVCENYGAIKCPVYAVGGFADGYTNTVFRLLEHLTAFCKGLVGPWGHKYPHQGDPGGGIGFLEEATRWWDRWLKEEPNGIEDEPRFQVWLQDCYNPLTLNRPGKWVTETHWPTPNVARQRFYLYANLLHEDNTYPRGLKSLAINSPLYVGLYAGKWCSYNASTDLPADQRLGDGGSTNFDTPPLTEDLEVLGAPKVKLALRSNEAIAMIAARISSIAPTGEVTRITYGVLNLTHRNGSESPQNLVPGERYEVEIPLNYIAQRFAANHKIRLSLSTTYWPVVWPSPKHVNIEIDLADCWLELPYRVHKSSGESVNFETKPDAGRTYPHRILEPAHREWVVNYNLATNESTLIVKDYDAKYLLTDTDLTFQRKTEERYQFARNSYHTLEASVDKTTYFKRADWEIRTEACSCMTATPDQFRLIATLDAYEGVARVFSQSWDETVDREFV
jgi:hypothetical protein